jgi:hypothetical protein
LGCSLSAYRVKIHDDPLGQRLGNSSSARGGHRIGHLVEAIPE